MGRLQASQDRGGEGANCHLPPRREQVSSLLTGSPDSLHIRQKKIKLFSSESQGEINSILRSLRKYKLFLAKSNRWCYKVPFSA